MLVLAIDPCRCGYFADMNPMIQQNDKIGPEEIHPSSVSAKGVFVRRVCGLYIIERKIEGKGYPSECLSVESANP